MVGLLGTLMKLRWVMVGVWIDSRNSVTAPPRTFELSMPRSHHFVLIQNFFSHSLGLETVLLSFAKDDIFYVIWESLIETTQVA